MTCDRSNGLVAAFFSFVAPLTTSSHIQRVTHDEALRRALELDRKMLITMDGGLYVVIWRRRYRAYLASVCRTTGRSTAEALTHMVNIEEEFRLLRDHGGGCPCEDCCLARVDRSRR